MWVRSLEPQAGRSAEVWRRASSAWRAERGISDHLFGRTVERERGLVSMEGCVLRWGVWEDVRSASSPSCVIFFFVRC